MRGTGLIRSRSTHDARITPAYAGNSVCSCCTRRPGWDHPRVCGEQEAVLSDRFQDQGSPPRMRGTGAINGIERARLRITPAYAGNSYVPSAVPSVQRDHPRVCGEQEREPPTFKMNRGSPPRMRGTDGASLITYDGTRITPAYAGNRALRGLC